MYFPQTRQAWQTPDLKQALQTEMQQQGLSILQKHLQSSSVALNDDIQIMILSSNETEQNLLLTIGIFYSGLITACSCSEDPYDSVQNEYCELQLQIDKDSAAAVFCAI